MATRLFCRQHVVLFGKNLQTYARALHQPVAQKCFSSQGSGDKRHPHAIVLLEENSEDVTVWPDPSLGLLGPKDVRMPLPGNVGFSQRLVPTPLPLPIRQPLTESEIWSTQTNYERQIQILKQSAANEDGIEEISQEDIEELLMDIPKASDVLECIAQDCPQLIQKDFAKLFPNRDVTSGQLTVVTLAQKTVNDMSGWSEAVEFEREELIACFIDAAKEVCSQLNQTGYWADFVDPTSGRPYLGQYTNDTMFETDERYRHLGFSIEDLGCCKVISHRQWGTHTFVGCIFTNAPADSGVLTNILRQQQANH